jgi:two-component system chemotaxis response regulator CheB
VVIEDSIGDRAQLVGILQSEGDIVVVGEATAAGEGIRLVARALPDVVILNLHLGDGGSHHAIEQIMARTPTPILVLSTRIDDRHSPCAVEALVAGALDALPAPPCWTPELGAGLRQNVRQLRKVRVIRHPRGVLAGHNRHEPAPGLHPQPVVAIAASTGGPSALAEVLAGLAGLQAPVLVVQHLHPDFTGGLVEWMARVSALPVEVAEHKRVARPGRVYVAPGGAHLHLGPHLRLELDPNPATTHRPSADQLFHSVAEQAGPAGVGVVLTGMGDDGAHGLLAMHLQGARTVAQDEASCAVFGMPQAARSLGAVTDMLHLNHMAAAINRAVKDVLA